jgi:CMP-N,N'-diacetyllegionaminic acid synthase
VSTDDMEIAVVAERYGAEIYERPAALACDSALVIDAIKDLIGTLRQEGETAELMVLLEPTCPFRQPEDISVCLAALANGRFDSVATFKDAVLNPHRAWRIVEGQPTEFITGAVPWLPRQQLPRAYQLNGAVYAFDMEGVSQQERALLFGRRGAVVMPPERSVDIDTEADFLMAETMLGVANG